MKVHIRTFGCRANHYDSEAVRALAISAGHEIVADVSDADVAVFNSCAVTAAAERDVRRAIRGAATRNPRLRSIVMGCASALPASAPTLRALPGVDRLIAGADMPRIAEALAPDPGGGLRAAATPETAEDAKPGLLGPQSGVRALLRVQDGCDEHCTFCATTMARGANRSRDIDELVREASALAEHHREIVITGTHIGTFGNDIGSSLGALMQRMVRDVPRVRFRLSSVEATEVDGALAELLTSDPARVAPHLHAPLQSGSNRLLRRMGRHWYTSERYSAAIERLIGNAKVFGLGADIIVGFPGETNQDFADTESLVRDLPFTYLHVFPYSPRPGTAATRLPDQVATTVVHERSARLRALADEKAAAYRRTRADGVADVIVVGASPKREGLTEDYLTVALAEPHPRGTRLAARLELVRGSLVAA